MTDTAPAYAQAIDQLRRERDDLRAQLETVTAERDAAIAVAPQGTDNIRHDFAAASQENIRLRLTIENLKTLAHAIVDAVAKETP